MKHAAHALALGIQKLFIRLPEAEPAIGFRAVEILVRWLDGARRITWLARGQYRAEFAERPNRYLLWRDPELRRLPSSLQGPLTLQDLSALWEVMEPKLQPTATFVARRIDIESTLEMIDGAQVQRRDLSFGRVVTR